MKKRTRAARTSISPDRRLGFHNQLSDPLAVHEEEDQSGSDLDLAGPLAGFYGAHPEGLLQLEDIRPAEIPQPYRRLLVHDRDMTRTLERFFGDRIHLRVLQRQRTEAVYARRVALCLDGSDRTVEYGAIEIHLELLPEAARREVLDEHHPLGAILVRHSIAYRGQPTGYIRAQPDKQLREIFALGDENLLYGRRNRLFTTGDGLLADILEILPPLTEKDGV